MKLDADGDEILNVETCNEFDDVLLTTALGQCIRFRLMMCGSLPAAIRSACAASISGQDDHIISMTIVHHVDADAAERAAYLKRAMAERRAATGEEGDVEDVALVGEDAGEDRRPQR
jgi:DNA gyrase subunit A